MNDLNGEWLKSALKEVQSRYPRFREALTGEMPRTIGREIGACTCSTDDELVGQAGRAFEAYKRHLGADYELLKSKGYSDRDIFVGTSLHGAKGFVKKVTTGGHVAARSEQASLPALRNVHVIDSLASASLRELPQQEIKDNKLSPSLPSQGQNQGDTSDKLSPRHQELKSQWGWTGLESEAALGSVDRAYYNSLWSWSGLGNYGKIGAVDAYNAYLNGGGVLAQAQRTKFFAGADAILNIGLAAAATYNSYDRTVKLAGKASKSAPDLADAQLAEVQASGFGAGGFHVATFLGTAVALPHLLTELKSSSDTRAGLTLGQKFRPGNILTYPTSLIARGVRRYGNPQAWIRQLERLNPTAARANVYAYTASAVGAGLVYGFSRDRSKISDQEFLTELGLVAACNNTFTFTGWAVAANQLQNDQKALLGYHDPQFGQVLGLQEAADQWCQGQLHQAAFRPIDQKTLVTKLLPADVAAIQGHLDNGKLDVTKLHSDILDMIPKAHRGRVLSGLATGELADLSWQSVSRYMQQTHGVSFEPIRLVTGFERTVPFLERSLGDARTASKIVIAVASVRALGQAYKKYRLSMKALNDQLRDGKITQDQYDAQVSEARTKSYKESGAGLAGAFGGGWSLAYLSRHAQPDAAAGRIPAVVRGATWLIDKPISMVRGNGELPVRNWLQNKATKAFMIDASRQSAASFGKKLANWAWTSSSVRGSVGVTFLAFGINALIDYGARWGLDKALPSKNSK